MVLVCKMAVRLATKLGKNSNGEFANRWKRRISIEVSRGMMYQAHYTLRKHLRYSMPYPIVMRKWIMMMTIHTCRNSEASTTSDQSCDEIYIGMKASM